MLCVLRSFSLASTHLRLYGTLHGGINSVVLRPYQVSCINACLDALKDGSTRIGVSLPTGSGKTTVFVTLLSRISPPSAFSTATRSLVIVNSIELALQAAAQTAKLCPQLSVEIEQGLKHNASGSADVYVFFSASYHSSDSYIVSGGLRTLFQVP